jgi:hypothetical protein
VTIGICVRRGRVADWARDACLSLRAVSALSSPCRCPFALQFLLIFSRFRFPSFPFSSVLFYFCFLRIRCASHIELWLYFHQSSKYGTLHYELFASAMQLQGLFLWLWVSKKGVNSETVRGCLYKCFNVEGPLPVRILYICVVKYTMADMRGSIPCVNHCTINSEDLNASLVG